MSVDVQSVVRLPHYLENPPADGSEIVSLTLQPSFIPQDAF
jgi:hypothetical protein